MNTKNNNINSEPKLKEEFDIKIFVWNVKATSKETAIEDIKSAISSGDLSFYLTSVEACD